VRRPRRVRLTILHEFDPSAPVWSKVAQSYLPNLSRPAAHVWVPQLERSDCGLAAVAMVGLRLGLAVSVQDLRRQAAPGIYGLSLLQLRDVAVQIGLACAAVRVSPDRLGQVSLPAVVHLLSGHYIVLHELSATGAVVGDPAAGIAVWSTEHLAQQCSGSLLLFGWGFCDRRAIIAAYRDAVIG
jgi:Peptidase C39 family